MLEVKIQFNYPRYEAKITVPHVKSIGMPQTTVGVKEISRRFKRDKCWRYAHDPIDWGSLFKSGGCRQYTPGQIDFGSFLMTVRQDSDALVKAVRSRQILSWVVTLPTAIVKFKGFITSHLPFSDGSVDLEIQVTDVPERVACDGKGD